MGQQCVTSATLIREDKKILYFFISIYKTCEIKNYTICNYKDLNNYINNNSSNNFKILKKKQEVRENFVQEVDSLIQKEKDENKILFFITVLTVLVSKYFEDHFDNAPDSREFYIDLEQDIFKILEKIILKNNSKIMLYFTAHLYSYLITLTQKIDIYISSEKYLTKLKYGLDTCKDILEEYAFYKEKFVENFGLLCVKSKVEVSWNIRNFVLDLIVSYLVQNASVINNNQQQLIFYYRKEKKSINQDISELEILMNCVSLYLDCFHKYLVQFTDDITTGKKLWKNMEELIRSKLDDQSLCQMMIEVIIMYIFSMSKSSNNHKNQLIVDIRKCKLIFSSIFEFLCDKLNSSKIKIAVGESSQSVNLNLFYEIIYNHVDILIDDILNERYMQIFARIFIEECLTEVVKNTNEENDKQLLIRLYEIISKHKEPLKLYISMINNTGKFFNTIKEENYLLDIQRENNKKLLKKIYIKLNLMLTNYCLFPNYEKPTLERDEVLIIISNFSTTIPELTAFYINFFIKFFFFIDSHFKIEIDFKHRKNVIIIIFEMLYDLTLLINENKIDPGNDEKIFYEQFIKLVELFYILLEKYSLNNIDDAYLIYRNCGALIKKIYQSFIDQLSDSQFTIIVFLVIFVINVVCKYNDLIGLYHIFTNTYDSFISTIENPILKENIENLFNLVEQNNFLDCFKFMRNSYNKKQFNEINSDLRKGSFMFKKINDENSRNIIPNALIQLQSKFFSTGNQFSQIFDDLMIAKGRHAFVKEFNMEMTYSNKQNKEYDSITEHSFLVSNRDFEFFANDSMKIAFNYDERKSILPINFSEKNDERKSIKDVNIFKSPFANIRDLNFEIKLNNLEEIAEDDIIRLSALRVDDYFKTIDINDIKI